VSVPWTSSVARGAALVLLGLVAGWACTPGEAATADKARPAADASASTTSTSSPAPAADAPRAADAELDTDPAVASGALIEPGVLRMVVAELAQGRSGPGGEPFEIALRTPGLPPGHARRFGTTTLPTALRLHEPDLSQYPCVSCHLGTGFDPRVDRVADAHQNIQPVHPAEAGAACSACHAAENVELLTLPTGERATLDHAYRLCAQCHYRQTDAWAAGAHGKRLDGWQGRRVVMGCTDCHDPHRPALETRMPFRPPIIHRSRQR
jgi:hypothetical protein